MTITCLDGGTLFPAGDAEWQRIAALGNFTLYDRTAPSEIVERAKDADILLTNKVVIDADTIAALPRLKFICILATGFNIVDIAAARKAGIPVSNIPAYSTMSVAQHAISLLLAIVSRVGEYRSCVAGGAWSSCRDFSFRLHDWGELAGKRFGVIGFGNIGQATARIAAALGMNIVVSTSKPQSALPEGYEKMTVDEIFRMCDVISLHCPLAPDTENMVNAARISTMKPDAILINTARGQLVDEQALADALNQGRIYAAGLDVLRNEPPKPDCPLLTAKNCFITPHIAWASVEARRRLMTTAVADIQAFLAGAPINVVN